MKIYLVLMIGCSVFMALATLFSVQMMTYLQILTPSNLIGKVISCVMCLCIFSNPLGQLAFGFVFEKIGANLYLPFYLAPFIMMSAAIVTRRIFNGIEELIEKNTREAVSCENLGFSPIKELN